MHAPQALQMDLPSASLRQRGVSVVRQLEHTVGPMAPPDSSGRVAKLAAVVAIEVGSAFLNSKMSWPLLRGEVAAPDGEGCQCWTWDGCWGARTGILCWSEVRGRVVKRRMMKPKSNGR